MPGSKQAGPSVLAGISLLLRSNTLERNTEQKFTLSFPCKTLALASEARPRTNRSERLSYRCGQHTAMGVPRQDQPFACQGLLPHPTLCQSSVPSPRCPPQARFPDCSQSSLQFEVFYFRLFFFFFLACQIMRATKPGSRAQFFVLCHFLIADV